jgi:hypothetical protein
VFIFCIATQIHKTFGGLVGTYTTKLSNPLGKKCLKTIYFFSYLRFTCNITSAFGDVVKDILKNNNMTEALIFNFTEFIHRDLRMNECFWGDRRGKKLTR